MRPPSLESDKMLNDLDSILKTMDLILKTMGIQGIFSDGIQMM